MREGGKKKTDPKANMIAEVILTLTFIFFSEQKKYIKGMEAIKDVYYIIPLEHIAMYIELFFIDFKCEYINVYDRHESIPGATF